MKEVKGYKAFNNDATNRYGKPFTEGETYRVTGDIKFGNNGNGFHMCTALSDIFRYVNATEEEVLVARVTGRGNMVCFDDTYYGYYDMYACEEITVDKFLSREEVIEEMLNSSSIQVKKFIVTCRLSEEEALKFVRKFRSNIEVIKTLLYYHFHNEDIYKQNNDEKECLRLVLKHGQDNNKGCEGK
jgi:hypothetical protein